MRIEIVHIDQFRNGVGDPRAQGLALAQRPLHLSARRDIPGDTENRRDHALLILQGHRIHFVFADLALRVPGLDDELPHWYPPCKVSRLASEFVASVFRKKIEEIFCAQLLPRIPCPAEERRIRVKNQAVGIGQVEEVRARLEDRAVASLALPQGFLPLFAFRDVTKDPLHANGLPLGVADKAGPDLNRDHPSLFAHNLGLEDRGEVLAGQRPAGMFVC